jgi:triosephosphate isomerase
LTPVIFVVEKEKKNSMVQTCKMLKNQLFPQFSGVDKKDINRALIIYEPTWAIGTGTAAPVDHTHAILAELRAAMNAEYGIGIGTRQLFMYGGGVTLESAKDIIALDNIDGIGMGKAGLNFEFFTGAIKVTIEMEKVKNLIIMHNFAGNR